MIWLQQFVLFLHVLAAVFWIGEILFVALVLGPLARTLPDEQRRTLLREVGRRALPLVWVAIGVLVVTGIGNLYFLGIGPARLLSGSFWATSFGWLLAAKLLGALGMIGHAVAHDVVYRRRARALRSAMAAAAPADRRELEREYAGVRRRAAAVGKGNLILALVVLFLAIGLGVRT